MVTGNRFETTSKRSSSFSVAFGEGVGGTTEDASEVCGANANMEFSFLFSIAGCELVGVWLNEEWKRDKTRSE